MKIFKKIKMIALLLLMGTTSFAQLGINTDSADPHSSAMLDVKSTDKGVLIPRMTMAQRNAIAAPQEGLMIYQTDDTKGFYYYTGSAWTLVGDGTADADASPTNEAQTLSVSGGTSPAISLSQIGGTGGGTVNLVAGTDISLSQSGSNVTITSTAGGGGGASQLVIKPSDQTTTSSTVINDNHFIFTLDANSTYLMEAEVLFFVDVFSDFKTGWSYSGTMAQVSYSTGRGLFTNLNETGIQPYGIAPVSFRGIFKTTTAGTLTFRWTTEFSTKTLKQNSFMILTKLD